MRQQTSVLSVMAVPLAKIVIAATISAVHFDSVAARGEDKADSATESAEPTSSVDRTGDHAAGHSTFGEAFDSGPRQAAYLMGGTGRVEFFVTTKEPRAQAFFNQGLGQLHGFWYFEAERSFRQVAAIDPTCAMAYWGLAAANVNNAERAAKFIAEAVSRKSNSTPREEMYIDAWSKYLAARPDKKQANGEQSAADKSINTTSTKDDAKADKKTDVKKSAGKKTDAKNSDAQRKRKQLLTRDLETIVQEHPSDIEAKALLAWHLWTSKDVLPINSYQAVDSILEWVFYTEPLHPAHHYRIHLWDDEKAARALHSAANCGQSAPSIAHMWHMPGHTYSKLKRYADAAWQQEAAARVDHAYMLRDRVMPFQIHNYAHNNEWCVRDLIYVGRANDALSLAKNLIELPRHPKLNQPSEKNSAAGYGRERLFDVLGKFELWNELIRLADTPYLAESGDEAHDVRRLRALAVAHFSAGNQIQGGEQLALLEQKLSRLQTELKPDGAKPPEQKTTDKQSTDQSNELEAGKEKAGELEASQQNTEDQTADELKIVDKKPAAQKADDKKSNEKQSDAKQAAPKQPDIKAIKDRIAMMEKAIAHVQGQRAALAGDHKAALALFEKAGDLDKSALARAYQRAGDHDKAEQIARKAVDAGREQVLPLAALVEVLHARGKTDEVKKTFEQLRALSAQLDLKTPPFERLEPIALSLGYGDSSGSADWRIAYKPPTDVGIRPPLASLGPFRWQPWTTDAWSLPDADQKTISLKRDFSGKPVVAIFYLGSGCLHCVEQLDKFVPLAKEFEEAGISLVGISTDTLAELKNSVDLFKVDGPFPFPLVSDSDLKVFKRYRCHDDFEQQPLHGTFLIDRDGLVRWQDIGSEPFLDAKFLLEESKRLLAQPRVEPVR